MDTNFARDAFAASLAQLGASLPDHARGSSPFRSGEFFNDMAVGVERHRRRVPAWWATSTTRAAEGILRKKLYTESVFMRHAVGGSSAAGELIAHRIANSLSHL